VERQKEKEEERKERKKIEEKEYFKMARKTFKETKDIINETTIKKMNLTQARVRLRGLLNFREAKALYEKQG
jgi:hypothetical protein